MSLKRFGVSLENELLEDLDRYADENGFANRSQAIRFLIEKNVAEQKWKCGHTVAGAVIIMYNQSKIDISAKIAVSEQDYQDVILSSSQYYLKGPFCLHVVTVTGEARRLTELSDSLIAIKGIRHGKLVMSRAD
jgi:CopG family nickel-responsive transcriptional regulator